MTGSLAVLFVLVQAIAFAWAASTPAQAGTRVALVIGNSAYMHVARLANPAADAAAVARLLRRIGFEVTEATDLDYTGLRRTLLDLAEAAQDADVAAIYYAGHGIEIGGRNYLIPIDARLETSTAVPLEAIALDQLLLSVQGAKGLRLVILDACRNNPFSARMRMTGGMTRAVSHGLVRVEPPPGALVAYAARAGTVALDGAGVHSPYAAALLRHLATPGLDVRIVFGRVRDAVMEATGGKQEPFIYGSLGGEILALVPAEKRPNGSVAAEAHEQPPPAPGFDARALELAFWQSIHDGRNPEDYEEYLRQFPNGLYAGLARNRLTELRDKGTGQTVARLSPEAVPPSERTPAQIEAALDLSRADWVRLQAGLTALGFDTHGVDGLPGHSTRIAIANWQLNEGEEPTGYLSAHQSRRILSRGGAKSSALSTAESVPDISIEAALELGRSAADHEEYAKAARWFRLAAEKGNAEAQNLLGLMYSKGRGVEQDYAAATRWFLLAAEQGYVQAQYNLGVMRAGRRRPERTAQEMPRWSREAVERERRDTHDRRTRHGGH